MWPTSQTSISMSGFPGGSLKEDGLHWDTDSHGLVFKKNLQAPFLKQQIPLHKSGGEKN